jgi:hypothetical protein
MTIFDEVKEILAEENPEALFADGLEAACIGVARRCGAPTLAVYDYDKVVDCFMQRDGMNYEEAVEWVEFNVVGAWVGEHTPIWFKKPDVE